MSSISCILLLHILFTLSTFPSLASCSKQSMFRICPIQLVFLLMIVSDISSPTLLVCHFVCPSDFLHSPPARAPPDSSSWPK
uniref:Putative product n=1 Tax=Xenopsylla cheopis TaxID=163159 RepID=A0A6M2DW05_XENCH